MAGLKRKFEGEIEIRVAGGDVFHELVHEKPHEINNIHPELIQGCDLHDGEFGTPGSVICWNYSIGMCRYISTFFILITIKI